METNLNILNIPQEILTKILRNVLTKTSKNEKGIFSCIEKDSSTRNFIPKVCKKFNEIYKEILIEDLRKRYKETASLAYLFYIMEENTNRLGFFSEEVFLKLENDAMDIEHLNFFVNYGNTKLATRILEKPLKENDYDFEDYKNNILTWSDPSKLNNFLEDKVIIQKNIDTRCLRRHILKRLNKNKIKPENVSSTINDFYFSRFNFNKDLNIFSKSSLKSRITDSIYYLNDYLEHQDEEELNEERYSKEFEELLKNSLSVCEIDKVDIIETMGLKLLIVLGVNPDAIIPNIHNLDDELFSRKDLISLLNFFRNKSIDLSKTSFFDFGTTNNEILWSMKIFSKDFGFSYESLE